MQSDQSRLLKQDESVSLFASAMTDRIVAVELLGDDQVRLYQRFNSGVTSQVESFSPWMVLSSRDASRIRFSSGQVSLAPGGYLDTLIHFTSWGSFRQTRESIRSQEFPHIAFPTPIEQYLTQSGQALFGGMQFEDLKRAQVDIETLGLDASDPSAEITIIAVAVNGEHPCLYRSDQYGEAGVIKSLNRWIREADPDVIEGHNIYNFDIPFLLERARRYGISLAWGRDGSSVRQGRTRRFKVGARTIPYDPAYVYGRHIVDTYQQIQRYDVSGRLTSYGLKQSVEQLGLTRSDREFVPGPQISEVWRTDPDRLARYAIDDVLDTNLLSELTLPTEFYQTNILPRGLQSVATGGPGEKVNDLLVRAYIARKQSIPLPDAPASYPGGYTAIRASGAFSPVVKADAESLYPSIMLRDRIQPASDRIGVFLPMLETLTQRRLAAKAAEQRSAGYERSRWQGIQSSLKVLINSFYGYLGYSRGYFSDFDAAREVTERGHEIILKAEAELRTRSNTIIEIDTDGIYFQPPATVDSEEQERRLVHIVSDTLGDGISLAYDGRWANMLSLKLKNYALLGYDGRLSLKGSSLRSRRDEPFVRRFIHDAILSILDPEIYGSVRERYLELAGKIQRSELAADEIARTETITDATFVSEAGRRLATAVQGERIGERVQVYQRQDHSLALVADYEHDEDQEYLLRRLRDAAGRFRVLYETELEFNNDFPKVSLSTDLKWLQDIDPVRQPRLF